MSLTPKARVINLLSTIERDGMTELLNWLEESSFYEDPASVRHHSNYPGGLVEHSLMLYKILSSLCKMHRLEISNDSLMIIAILHDVCKIGSYSIETRNMKNEKTNNQWKAYKTYGYKDNNALFPHGMESVKRIQQFIKLTEEEQLAILYHMGHWSINDGDSKAMEKAIKAYPVVLLTQHADAQATFLQERQYEVDEIPFK